MLVHERMTYNPITVYPDLGVAEALQMMRERQVRRFPVIDRRTNKLVGIVTEKELLYASPSPATSLSIHEINYLLSKLTVEKVMTAKPITVQDDTPIEEAARIMVDHRIGGLPVMRGETLVGIITETDLFKTFLELFAARQEGLRLTLLVPEQRGQLAAITGAITELGGDILSLGTFLGDDPTNRLLTIKITDLPQHALMDKLSALGVRVIDSRMIGAS
ncbi:MAG: CBS domain-containing protein [Anaerolineae bacterium]|nr:CBS domain-containing protein [Anaerolineae bacterium]